MKISYLAGVCVRNDAISNAVCDEIRFLADRGDDDLRLYTYACDYETIPHTLADNFKNVILDRHFQTSDLIVFHFGIYSPLLNLLPITPKKAKKIVVFHNITPSALVPEDSRTLIERSFAQLQNLRWADRVICVSDTNRELLREHHLDRDAVVVPLAVHSSLRAPLSKPSFRDEVLRILFISRFTPAKGPDQLLRALEVKAPELRRLGYRQVKVDLVGNLNFSDQRLLVQLLATIKSLHVQDNLLEGFLHGNATDETKNRLLQEADIFALPTQHEGFCVPIVEAIGSGCRVVAYDNSNMPAICGGLGTLVPTSNIDALADAIASVADEVRSTEWRSGSSASSYASFAKLGAEHLRQFAPESVAPKFLEAVQQAMNDRRPTPRD
ncbi:glycosyltransferase family 4 protein [Variovorax sp. J22P271]|uniref:glycosyltransferase family 4 protein n=1 Tax=Variovorax davisae TaxID=3053515 RepID=UPI002575FF11|nr:glycosyltransferase family 4 protein [Variovorax sp. J22P271]MDM0033286.1 glycosyltransferase family 4 protein [Variovorax sp. J22P271]